MKDILEQVVSTELDCRAKIEPQSLEKEHKRGVCVGKFLSVWG